MEKAENFLWWAIFSGLVFIICFPLLGDYGKIFFPLGRDTIFRAIVGALFFFYLILIYFNFSFLPQISPVLCALCFFWIISGLATIFSSQPLFSFFGNPFRGHGFLSQTHFFLFFIIISAVLKDKDLWKIISWIAIGASLPVCFIGFFEKLNGGERIQSTLNNPNFFSAYLLLIIFITAAFLFEEKKPFALQGDNSFKKGFLMLALISQVLGIIFSGSRGSLIGFALGALFFLLFFFWPLLVKTKKRKIIFLTAMLFLTLSSIFFVWRAKYIEKVYRIALSPISEIGARAQSASYRLEACRTAILGIKERPLFGFGPENFVVAFDKYYSGNLENTNYPWFDKVHNVFLETGVTTGLAGLIAYLMIWFFVFRALFPLSGNNRIMKIGLLATFVAYLSQNMFNIDTTTSLIYIYFWWGFSNFLWSLEKQQ